MLLYFEERWSQRMRLAIALAVLAMIGGASDVEAATKKKPKPKPVPTQKVSPWELCKRLVAKDSGVITRVQRYQIRKDGTLVCWYMM
jgi:hypothetical protein